MANEKFQAGDVVQLKSGGPSMTVEAQGSTQFEGEKVFCVWFEGNKQIKGRFVPSALKKVD